MWLREVFRIIGKWLTPTVKDKKVTYFNSSLNPLQPSVAFLYLLKTSGGITVTLGCTGLNYGKREYAIKLIPEKSYKKGLVFRVTDSKTYHKSFAKTSKGLFEIANDSI